jgi:branched-chain amino acid transport system permease protein
MNDWLNYLNLILIFSIFAVSLNLLLGYAGVLSSGQAALGAIGGYTTAWLALDAGWNGWVAVALGVVFAGIVGILLAIPSLPLSAEYLILLTLVAGEAVLGIVVASPSFGGTLGLTGLPGSNFFGIDLKMASNWVLPLIVFAAVIFLLCWRIGESPFGRVLRATRDDDRAAAAVGKHVFAYRLWVFGITAAMSGLGGGLLALYLGICSPSVYSFDVSMGIFAMVVLGGVGNLYGSILGAVIVTLTAPILQRILPLAPESGSFVRIAIYGLVLILVIRFRPQGILPERHGRRAKPTRALTPPPEALIEVTEGHQLPPDNGTLETVIEAPADGSILVTSDLSKSFGTTVAADSLAMGLATGKITALVGPNGAGKTTVFNLLTGYLRPDRGSVWLGGRDLAGMRPDEIAMNGVVRTFQDVRLWTGMSVLDNVAVAIPDQPGEHIGPLFRPGAQIGRREDEVRERAMEWLGYVGLEGYSEDLAGSLSYGQSKLLSLARVMATEAPVVLLDEPVSGVDTAWAEAMLSLIETMRESGRTICLVEHNLHVVDRLADHAYFMDLGRIIAEGSLSELTSSPELARTYFGILR